MQPSLTIGQLSKRVGLPTKTIRFYESQGIIANATRGNNGYRLYPDTIVEELTLIKNARELGLPLSEIKKLMIGCESKETCHHTQQYITSEIENYLTVLHHKIAQFQALEKSLINLKNNLALPSECHEAAYCCNLLKQVVEDGKENYVRSR